MVMKGNQSIHDATHVRGADGQIRKIKSKWGIDREGRLAKPSEGGFGCETEDGQQISMWEARQYYKEESE